MLSTKIYLLDMLRIRKIKYRILSPLIPFCYTSFLYVDPSLLPISFFVALEEILTFIEGLLVMNSLKLHMSEKILISLSIFKNDFPGCRILG